MSIDFTLLIPEFILAGLGVLVLAVDMALPQTGGAARRNTATALVAAAGLAVAFVVAVATQRDTAEIMYDGLLFIDGYALLFKALFMVTGFAVIAMSHGYVASRIRHPGEFYSMVVFAVLGATLMAEAGELLTAYIAIELLAFSLYVLVALSRGDKRSAEASAKYILLGAISSAFMLFGISLLYGTMGTTVFQLLDARVYTLFEPTVILGFVLFVAGLGFKLSMFPFHMWVPDVYEGAPTPVTALVAVLSKAAAVALALRFLADAAALNIGEWQLPLAIIAAITIVVGTLAAMTQTNIKRLMAYSSIAQVGFVMVGLVALNETAANAVVLHLIGYAATNLAAFMVIIAVETHTGKEEIDDYAGLSSRSPFAALVLTSALFSLAGLPIFAGFITKFYLFTAAVDADLMWLVAIAVTASLVSLYYYLRVIRVMYVDEAKGGTLKLPVLTGGSLWALFGGTVFVGVYPGPIVDAVDAATNALRPFI